MKIFEYKADHEHTIATNQLRSEGDGEVPELGFQLLPTSDFSNSGTPPLPFVGLQNHSNASRDKRTTEASVRCQGGLSDAADANADGGLVVDCELVSSVGHVTAN